MIFVFRAVRVLIVILVSLIDVKVKADTLFTSLAGEVEVDKNGKVDFAEPLQLVSEPFSVETLGAKSFVRMKVASGQLNLGPNTHLQIDSPSEIILLRGRLLLTAPSNVSEIVKTLHGNISLASSGQTSEVIVEVSKTRTLVSVLSGEAELIDRGSNTKYKVKEGYHAWLGGLQENGKRETGDIEAFSFDDVINDFRLLSPLNPQDFQKEHDRLKILWAAAVEDTSIHHQGEVMKDLKRLWAYDKRVEHNQWLEHVKETNLKKYFRDQMLNGPSENGGGPSD